jgi:hypothetical protein
MCAQFNCYYTFTHVEILETQQLMHSLFFNMIRNSACWLMMSALCTCAEHRFKC